MSPGEETWAVLAFQSGDRPLEPQTLFFVFFTLKYNRFFGRMGQFSAWACASFLIKHSEPQSEQNHVRGVWLRCLLCPQAHESCSGILVVIFHLLPSF